MPVIEHRNLCRSANVRLLTQYPTKHPMPYQAPNTVPCTQYRIMHPIPYHAPDIVPCNQHYAVPITQNLTMHALVGRYVHTTM
jgi:hypothetical protein